MFVNLTNVVSDNVINRKRAVVAIMPYLLCYYFTHFLLSYTRIIIIIIFIAKKTGKV